MIELKLQSEWPKILQRLSAMAIVFDLACNGMNGGKISKAKIFQYFCCCRYHSYLVFRQWSTTVEGESMLKTVISLLYSQTWILKIPSNCICLLVSMLWFSVLPSPKSDTWCYFSLSLGVKLITDVHLVTRIWVCRSIPPLPYTSYNMLN